mmetsp:Transcript_64444/g.185203  ORF Transcript_64444/g.185203 Transcript_64444/m.185203 type:complete len:213 (+) Transcript_64444:140-778(+)
MHSARRQRRRRRNDDADDDDKRAHAKQLPSSDGFRRRAPLDEGRHAEVRSHGRGEDLGSRRQAGGHLNLSLQEIPQESVAVLRPRIDLQHRPALTDTNRRGSNNKCASLGAQPSALSRLGFTLGHGARCGIVQGTRLRSGGSRLGPRRPLLCNLLSPLQLLLCLHLLMQLLEPRLLLLPLPGTWVSGGAGAVAGTGSGGECGHGTEETRPQE